MTRAFLRLPLSVPPAASSSSRATSGSWSGLVENAARVVRQLVPPELGLVGGLQLVLFLVPVHLGLHELENRVLHHLQLGELVVVLGPVGAGVQPQLRVGLEDGGHPAADLGRGDLHHESKRNGRAEAGEQQIKRMFTFR